MPALTASDDELYLLSFRIAHLPGTPDPADVQRHRELCAQAVKALGLVVSTGKRYSATGEGETVTGQSYRNRGGEGKRLLARANRAALLSRIATLDGLVTARAMAAETHQRQWDTNRNLRRMVEAGLLTPDGDDWRLTALAYQVIDETTHEIAP